MALLRHAQYGVLELGLFGRISHHSKTQRLVAASSSNHFLFRLQLGLNRPFESRKRFLFFFLQKNSHPIFERLFMLDSAVGGGE